MANRMRKTAIQIVQPAPGYSDSEMYTLAQQPPLIADAYLYNGEPINNLTATNQLIPNIQTLENKALALALSKRYPNQRTFKGFSIVENNDRTSWYGPQV